MYIDMTCVVVSRSSFGSARTPASSRSAGAAVWARWSIPAPPSPQAREKGQGVGSQAADSGPMAKESPKAGAKIIENRKEKRKYVYYITLHYITLCYIILQYIILYYTISYYMDIYIAK